MNYRLVVCADHGGFHLKQTLVSWLLKTNPFPSLHLTVEDMGTHDTASIDYPDITLKAVEHMASLQHQSQNSENSPQILGLFICGSGIGVSIAANRHAFIRAALVTEPLSASLSRRHNNANVLCLGARLMGEDMAKASIEAFLTTSFEGGRHERRVAQLSALFQ